MLLLIIFAFIGGVVTILSPCILPILPVVLSSSLTGGKKSPLGVVTGFILSFTFFTLFLSLIVKSLGIPADSLRSFSIVVIALFGIGLLLPNFRTLLEKFFTYFSRFGPKGSGEAGFFGGVLIGASVGLVWTPCVGPILASIISLAIFFNFDRKFQTYILDKFPNYGIGLTSFEDNSLIKDRLKNLRGDGINDEDMGKPMFNLLDDSGVNAPGLIQGGDWFNTKPLTLKELRGKVVMVDFWTYTCINCIRTLPYLKNWHEKYASKGLVIIGVHTPEFEFEKSAENVQKAIQDFGIKYPVMQDNNFATWRAYDNHYWPAKYIVDKNGKIRYT